MDQSDVFKTQICHYTTYLDMSYINCFSWTGLCFIICCQRCLYTQFSRYKQLGVYNRRVMLLCGGGVTAVWAVLVNICNLDF